MERNEFCYMKEDELIRRAEWYTKAIAGVKMFKEWFDQHPTVTKNQLLEKYDEIVNIDDYRRYALRTAKKDGRANTVAMIYQRTVVEGEPILFQMKAEQERRVVEQKQREASQATAKKMYTILSKYLETNEVDGRQLDCLEALIDNGSITTPEELGQYGVII